jgi:hypothetical protein
MHTNSIVEYVVDWLLVMKPDLDTSRFKYDE